MVDRTIKKLQKPVEGTNFSHNSETIYNAYVAGKTNTTSSLAKSLPKLTMKSSNIKKTFKSQV